MPQSREFDIIVYGATGYTGRLVAEYLQSQYGNGAELKWAMAGRSGIKLAAVREEMGLPENTHLITANSDDFYSCLLYTSPSPRDRTRSRMPSSA